jgi:hypothetical protein
MKTPLLTAFACALTLALQTGCESSGPSARIQEKSAVFATLTSEQQTTIREGTIELGYTADMVYMALGKPSKVKAQDDAEGRVEMWTYNNFYPTVAVTQLAMNDPGRKYKVAQITTNYPRLDADGNPAPSISTTKPTGPEPGVDTMADIPSDTLYVLLLNDRVFQLKLESQSG